MADFGVTIPLSSGDSARLIIVRQLDGRGSIITFTAIDVALASVANISSRGEFNKVDRRLNQVALRSRVLEDV